MPYKSKRQNQLQQNAKRARLPAALDAEAPELDEFSDSGDDGGDSSDDENFVATTETFVRQQTITSFFEKYSSKLQKQIICNLDQKRTRLIRQRADDDDDSPSLQKFSESDDGLVAKKTVRKLSKLLKEVQHLHLPFPTEVDRDNDKFESEKVVGNGADKQVTESTTVSVSIACFPTTKALTKYFTSHENFSIQAPTANTTTTTIDERSDRRHYWHCKTQIKIVW